MAQPYYTDPTTGKRVKTSRAEQEEYDRQVGMGKHATSGEALPRVQRSVKEREKAEKSSAVVTSTRAERQQSYYRVHRVGPENAMPEDLQRAAAYAAATGDLESAKKFSEAVPAAEKVRAERAVQTGARGGRYYISPSGAKVYIKDNPGAVVMTPTNPFANAYQVRGPGPWKACESVLDKILK
jgi:hypothetical protein